MTTCNAQSPVTHFWFIRTNLEWQENKAMQNLAARNTRPLRDDLHTWEMEDMWGLSSRQDLGQGIAQLVKRLTEKPGTILYMGSSPRCGALFLPESSSSEGSLTVSVQPLCVTAYINICEYVKNLKHWQPYHYTETRKHCMRLLEWVALLFRLLCHTHRGQYRTKKMKDYLPPGEEGQCARGVLLQGHQHKVVLDQQHLGLEGLTHSRLVHVGSLRAPWHRAHQQAVSAQLQAGVGFINSDV